MGGDGDLERCAKRHLALSGSSRGRRVWCLGWNPSAPALQHLPVAASERGSRERCGDSLQNGAPSLSHTLSGCQTQAFLFLDAYGIQLSGVGECASAKPQCASRGRPSSGFFLLLSLSAVVLAASDAALLFSGQRKGLSWTRATPRQCAKSNCHQVDESQIIQNRSAVCLGLRCRRCLATHIGWFSEEDAKGSLKRDLGNQDPDTIHPNPDNWFWKPG